MVLWAFYQWVYTCDSSLILHKSLELPTESVPWEQGYTGLGRQKDVELTICLNFSNSVKIHHQAPVLESFFWN